MGFKFWTVIFFFRFSHEDKSFLNIGAGVAIEEVGRVMVPHLVQLGTADFSDKWAVLFSEAPKELPDRLVLLYLVNTRASTTYQQKGVEIQFGWNIYSIYL